MSGMPQPWWTRVRSWVVPLNGYWSAVLIMNALAVVMCGRFSNTVPRGSTSLPKMPSDHIWKNRPT